jgi:putative ABC transport system permease protein
VGASLGELFSSVRPVPERGQVFTAEEDRRGAGNFAVISDALWKRDFGGDPHTLNKTISLSGAPYTVLGIMPPGIQTISDFPIDVWPPFQIDPASTDQNHYFYVAGRVKDGVLPGEIQARLQNAAAEFHRQFRYVSTMPPGAMFVAEPLRDALVREIRPSLLVLPGAVTLVLLVTCANAANLLLAGSIRRKREIAIRSAIGAGRGRIARQLLAESIVLSLAGGAFGLALGAAGIRALLAINPGNIPRIGPHGIAVTSDARVVLFTFGAVLLTGVLFGLIPGLQTSRIDVVAALNENTGRSGAGFRRNKARSLLTIAGDVARVRVADRFGLINPDIPGDVRRRSRL